MINTDIYKKMLELEQEELINDLKSSSVKDPVTGEYNTVPSSDEQESDELDIATRDEYFEEDAALNYEFSDQLKDVKDALNKIENGTYGTCEECNQNIEEDRLAAVPSARTCSVHMNN